MEANISLVGDAWAVFDVHKIGQIYEDTKVLKEYFSWKLFSDLPGKNSRMDQETSYLLGLRDRRFLFPVFP